MRQIVRSAMMALLALLVATTTLSVVLWRDLHQHRDLVAQLSRDAGDRTVSSPTDAGRGAVLPTAAPENSGYTVIPGPAGVMDAQFAAMSFRARELQGMFASRAASAGRAESDLLVDPEYRSARLTQLRLEEAHANPGLAEAIGLTESEAARLFDLIARHRLESDELFDPVVSGQTDPDALAERMHQRAESHIASLRDLLGDTRYRQFQDYQQDVRPALLQLTTYANTLRAGGQPMSSSQYRALASWMAADQKNQRERAPTSGTGSEDPSEADTLLAFAARQDASNQRFLDEAGRHLTLAQLTALREQLEEQAARRRDVAESSRRRAERPVR